MTDPSRRDVLAQALREIRELKAQRVATDARLRAPIAVVGLGCRLPGADDPDALWRLLCDRVDATGDVPPGRWTDPEPPGMYTRRGGWLRDTDGFDAAFFGVGPREAESLDPQQRLFLEVVWETLEHAAIAPDHLRDSRTGVYCGITQVDYAQVLAAHADPAQLDGHAGTGVSPNFAAGRVARLLDLRGPALAIDTACSSSLVAVHLAVEALRRGSIDLALAGGVNLILHPAGHAVLCQARALSRTGRCHTFDAAADGYARAEGCGVVALARLDDARRAGHRILAVIRGSAVGHDGASAGLTVPSGQAQAAVITAACLDAGVDPRTIAYVEAHGTGTPLGDPIELRALADALGRERGTPLRVGALKTNLGHLESAAGVAGLIKVVLALHHRELPPQLGPARPNPAVDWARLPLEIVRARSPWPAGPRLAGVSAFGASGTNAHVVLAAADDLPDTTHVTRAAADSLVPDTDAPDAPELLVLSAATPTALTALAARWAAALPAAGPLAAVCRTAALGRAALPHALAVVARTCDELTTHLDTFATTGTAAHVGRRPANSVPLAFVFAGQGARPELAPDLFEKPGPYRAALERCDAILRPHRPGSLIDLLAPTAGESPLDDTAWAQPALFALEWALVEQWRAWGVEPRWVLGHSLGAFVAACVAGVMDLDQALPLVARRAELMQQTAPGAMAAVFAREDHVRRLLADLAAPVVVAAVNGPEDTVIAGDPAALAEALRVLESDGIRSRLLAVRRAFHSPLMDPILDEFAAALARVPLREPDRIFISDTTGRPATRAFTDPAVWRRHLREPVRFADALHALRDDGCSLCLELGPGAALSAAGRRAGGPLRWIPSLRRDTSGRHSMLDALGQLAVAGARVDLRAATRGPRTLALPTYPFERRRAWIGPGGRSEPLPDDDSLLGRRLDTPDHEAIFEARWRAEASPVLRDHTVFGCCVVSGAVAGSVALAAARQLDGDRPFLLESLEFHAPVVLPARGGLTVRTRLVRRDDHLEWTLESREGPRTRVHVSGRIRPTCEPPPPLRDLAAIRARCAETLTGDTFYATCWRPEQHGLGPSYRTLDQIWRRDGEALARLRPPAFPDAPEAALWTAISCAEATGQLLMPAVPGFERVFGERGDTFLGSGMTRSVQHDLAPRSAAWIHARLDVIGPEGFAGEVAILDDEGRAIVVTEGLAVRRIAPAQLDRSTAPTHLADGRRVLEAPPEARADRLRAWLDDTVTALVGGERLDRDVPLARLGFDSLAIVDLLERLHAALHVRLAPGDGLRDHTLDTLAAQILRALELGHADDTSPTDDRAPHLATNHSPITPADDRAPHLANNHSPITPTDDRAPHLANNHSPITPTPIDDRASHLANNHSPDALPSPWRLIGASVPAPRLRLFCLPHAGASVLAFQPWRLHIPPGIEVCAAQLPGRWTEPGAPLTDLDALLAALLADLRPRLDATPWAFFGASLGGLLAFELTRALRRLGGPQPTFLVVAGTPAPEGPHPLTASAPEIRAALAGAGDPHALVRLGLLPEAQVPADMLALLVPALRADLELVLDYRHRREPPLACPIVCLLGAADLAVRREHVAGWVDHTEGEFTLRRVDGGHLFYRDAPAETWRALSPWLPNA